MNAATRSKALLIGAGIVLFIGVLVLGIVGIELAQYQATARAGHPLQPTPTATRDIPFPSCDMAGMPACTTPDPGWIPLTSNAPSAVVTAMKQTWIFHVDLSDDGDHIHDVSHLGAPLLIRGIAPAGKTISDFYILPFMDAHGVVTDVGEFELNSDHTALRFAAVTSVDGRYPVVRQTADAAVAAVWAQRHVAPKPNTHPYLVFFPIDAADLETGRVVWDTNAGGLAPVVPLWLVTGADGNNYIYGNNGKVYAEREIPMS